METKEQRLQTFENHKSQMLAALEKEEKILTEQIEKFEERVKNWEEATAKLQNSHFPSKIKLDVGGRIFSTSLSNLQRYPDSFFGVMFSGRWDSKPGEDGCYFIDRSPRVFDHIIDYLRGEQNELELISSEKKALLIREAKFYQLPQLVDILEPLAKPTVKEQWEFKPSPYGTLSNLNRTFTKNRAGNVWDCNVMGSIGWSSGVHEWTVILGENCLLVMIGIATNDTNPTGNNYNSRGFYLHTSDGTLYGQNGTICSSYINTRLNVKQIISVSLDMDSKTLTFGVDRVWKNIAFKNLPQAIYYPSFDVCTNQATFTIIP